MSTYSTRRAAARATVSYRLASMLAAAKRDGDGLDITRTQRRVRRLEIVT